MNSTRINPSEGIVEQETVRDKGKVGTRTAWVIMVACALVAIVCVGFPMYVIRPSRPQGVRELAVALAVRNAGPGVSIFCAIVTVIVFIWRLKELGYEGTATIEAGSPGTGGDQEILGDKAYLEGLIAQG